jgi:hypothetical protein
MTFLASNLDGWGTGIYEYFDETLFRSDDSHWAYALGYADETDTLVVWNDPDFSGDWPEQMAPLESDASYFDTAWRYAPKNWFVAYM